MRTLFVPQRRLGVPEVAFDRDYDGFGQLVNAEGTAIQRRDIHARLAIVLESQNNYASLSPTIPRPNRVRGWCRSWGEHEWRIQQAVHGLGPLIQGIRDNGLREAEHEQWRKMLLQDGRMPGWDIHPRGLRLQDGAELSHLWGEGLRAVLNLLPRTTFDEALKAHDTLSGTSYPRGTNHGPPTFSKSDLDLALHAGIAALGTDWRTLDDLAGKVAAVFGYSEELQRILSIQFSRTGGSARGQQTYEWEGDELRLGPRVTGTTPRGRITWGMAALANIRLNGLYAALRLVVKRLPGAYHRLASDDLSTLLRHADTYKGAKTWSDDLSGFDLSVTKGMKRAIMGVMADFLPKLATDIEVWRQAEEVDVISGPLTRSASAFLYVREGMITSGLKLTSVIGTLINLDRAVISIALAKSWTLTRAAEAYMAAETLLWVQGDDTVIRQDGLDPEKYVEITRAYGLQNTMLPGATFLMRYFDEVKGTFYPLASRIFQMTVWREHPPQDSVVELLGLAARTADFDAHPLAPDLYSMLADGEVVDRYDLTWPSHERAVRALERIDVREELAASLSDWQAVRPTLNTFLKSGEAVEGSWAEAILTSLGRGQVAAESLDLRRRGLSEADVLRLAEYLNTPAVEREGVDPPSPWSELVPRRADEATAQAELQATDYEEKT